MFNGEHVQVRPAKSGVAKRSFSLLISNGIFCSLHVLNVSAGGVKPKSEDSGASDDAFATDDVLLCTLGKASILGRVQIFATTNATALDEAYWEFESFKVYQA